MASAVITIPAGGGAGASLRKLSHVIGIAASTLPDRNGTGAPVTCTINDTPGGSGIASVLIAGGGLPAQITYTV